MIYYGRECQIYGNQDADVYIFCFFHDCTSIVESLKKNYCLIAPVIKDWNSELSPWPADGFGGKGEELEKWILSTMNSSHHYILLIIILLRAIHLVVCLVCGCMEDMNLL